MKLIPLIILTISLAVDNKAHEHFTFPPQFQSGMFTSEKNPYLPPEADTPIPYFQMNMNNINKLPFPYLPPTATKAPFGYPSPFPLLISSTLRPLQIEEDDDEDEDEKPTTQVPQYLRNKMNRTQRMPNQMAERREMRPIPKSFQNPIDRIDTKMAFQFNTSPDPPLQTGVMQTVAPRSISIMDIQRDHGMDQMKAASFPGAQYVPQPGIYISSTTETAIPILRLSNEMDLDGSFSYEALGADQTHYVQHSRMENAGTGKDEQVVEGSYSYVGDNGKTYTVHYIADANGFRASGDHLPVAPPIPEIIQRAIQYNLAEESKKPPHLKSWSGEQQENELSESEKRHQFAVTPPRLSNLFTGKTPESFSHSFSQPSNTQNNLVAAASTQNSVQAAIDFADQMQTKQNSGTISPQITFLASQGAHVPSVNTPQQQPINRIFTTEKSTMPQLVNYEANLKESDTESNKALWRWQYGINANANQNMEKNSISRSLFGEDDIVINFNDMNSEQYTKMIKQQLETDVKENPETPHQEETPYYNNNKESNFYADYKSNPEIDYSFSNDNINPEMHVHNNDNNEYSSEIILPVTHSAANQLFTAKNQYKSIKNTLQNTYDNPRKLQNEGSQTSWPKLITQEQFIPQSQTVTQTYNYDDDNFESRRTKMLSSDTSNSDNLNVLPLNYENYIHHHNKPEKRESKNETKITATQETNHYHPNHHQTNQLPTPITATTTKPTTNQPTTNKWTDLSTISSNKFKFSDFIVPENKEDFKPLFKFTEPEPKPTTTTTEASIENAFEDNIFLKNLFRNNKNEQEVNNNIREENNNKINFHVKPIDTRNEKHQKFIQYPTKPHNENRAARKKPMDITDIVNYLSRNQFESSRLKLAPKQTTNSFKQKNELRYYTPEQVEDIIEDNQNRNQRTLHQQEELRGVIKNYKVLHRNNNFANAEQDDVDGLRRNLSPPHLKSLPPLGRAGPSMKSYLPPVYV